MAVEARRLQRLHEGAGAADFDYMVGPAAAGDLAHLLRPFGRRLVVDQMIGPERLGTLQLFVRRGGRDHRAARRLGELQREDRDAAGALHHHGIAGLEAAFHEPPPRRETRARQRRDLLIGEEGRDLGHALLRQQHVLREAPVVRSAERGEQILHLRPAADPLLEEGGRDAVADLHAGDVGANFLDDAAAVRKRDMRQLVAPAVQHASEIAIVQRRRLHAQQHLSRTGPRNIAFYRIEVLNAEGI